MADRKITDQNVFFLSGFQSTLDKNVSEGKIQVGAFYLTEDTNRLYIGKEAGKLDLLNSTVKFVNQENFANLGTAWKGEADKGATHANELVYITDLNILAVWIATGNASAPYDWVQINPDTDTKLTEVLTEVSATSNVATVSNTFKSSNGNAADDFSKGDSFKIAGAGKTIKVEAPDGETISITGDTYTLAAAKNGDGAKVSLSSALGQAGSEFTNSAGENVSINASGSNIEIASEKWIPDASSVEVADGKIILNLKDADGNGPAPFESNELFVTVGVGEGNTKDVLIGGDLGVYTAAQVDAKLRGLNGMTYRSTVGPANTTVSASYFIHNNAIVNADSAAIEVSNGDVFLVVCDKDSSNNPVPIAFNGYDLITGDLIIAVGTEDENGFIGSDLAWNVVPAGNDTIIDTTYKFEADAVNHKIALMSSRDGSTGEVGAIDLDAGDDIVLTSESQSDGKVLKTTIKHATITTATPAATTVDVANGETGISVIESLEISNGHVTKVTSKKLDLPKYSLNAFEAVDTSILGDSRVSSKDIITISSVLKADDSVAGEIAATFESKTLRITRNSVEGEDPVIGFELTWGTF